MSNFLIKVESMGMNLYSDALARYLLEFGLESSDFLYKNYHIFNNSNEFASSPEEFYIDYGKLVTSMTESLFKSNPDPNSKLNISIGSSPYNKALTEPFIISRDDKLSPYKKLMIFNVIGKLVLHRISTTPPEKHIDPICVLSKDNKDDKYRYSVLLTNGIMSVPIFIYNFKSEIQNVMDCAIRDYLADILRIIRYNHGICDNPKNYSIEFLERCFYELLDRLLMISTVQFVTHDVIYNIFIPLGKTIVSAKYGKNIIAKYKYRNLYLDYILDKYLGYNNEINSLYEIIDKDIKITKIVNSIYKELNSREDFKFDVEKLPLLMKDKKEASIWHYKIK